MIAALGLDIGRKRIGIAGCDGLGLLATGLTTLRRSSFGAELAFFQAIVQERRVETLVVGLPYRGIDDLGPQAKEIQRYAKRLGKALGLPVVYVNEHSSSLEAEAMMVAAGQSPSQNRALVDRKAAAVILQRWLDDRPRP